MNTLKTKITRMRNEDVATVGKRVVETIEKSVAEDIKESLLFTQLKETMIRFSKSIEPDNKEEREALDELFNNRKQQFKNFFYVVSGLKGSKDPAVKAAATSVFYVLNLYGGIGFKDLTKNAHTQRYSTIITTLKQAEYTEAIAKLNVDSFLSELEEANSAYEAKYQNLGNRQSMRTPSREMRSEIDNALKEITDEVKLFARKYPTEANQELIRNVEQRIQEIYVPTPGYTKKENTSSATKIQNSATGEI